MADYSLPNQNVAAIGQAAGTVAPNPLGTLGASINSGASLGLAMRQQKSLEQERATQLMQAQASAKIAQEKQLIDYMGVAHETYKDLADVNPEHAFQFYKTSIAPLHSQFLQQHGIQADFSDVNSQDEHPAVIEKINEIMDRAASDPGKVPSAVVTLQQMANMPSTGKMMRQKLEDSMKALGSVTDANKHQDDLEQNYKQQFISLRSDPVLKQLETQRNAAGQAYTILRKNQDETGSYNLTKPQLIDLYGQLYKAQTGTVNEQAMKGMDQLTLQGIYSKVAAYAGLAKNATPKQLGDRILKMAEDTGEYNENQHAQMMQSRMTPVTGLNPDRASKLEKDIGRGYTFQQLKDQADKASKYQPNGQMVTFTDSHGISHSIPAKNLPAARKRDPGLVVQ